MTIITVPELAEGEKNIFAGNSREGDGNMPQDEKWHAQYDEVVAFINKNHRNPSKYLSEERGLVNWCKHQRKIINAGEMKPERMRLFEMLQELMEKYKRVNQYV